MLVKLWGRSPAGFVAEETTPCLVPEGPDLSRSTLVLGVGAWLGMKEGVISILSLNDFFRWNWGLCGDLALLLLTVASAEGLARELEPLWVSVCEAPLALETGWPWVTPTGHVWASPTWVGLWASPTGMVLWALPTGVVFSTPTKGVSGWAPPTLDCSNACSLCSYPSNLCCSEVLAWRSVMMTSFNLPFSSLRARLWLTRSALLWARTWANELAAGSVVVCPACSVAAGTSVVVCPACSLAAGSVQWVSAWIWRALFSVIYAGHSLLVAECELSQFGHFNESLFGQLSCLWLVPEHNVQTSVVARQVLEL